MKKKISQTVLEYVKKNPLQLTSRWLRYLKRKKYKVIDQGSYNELPNYYHYSLIFPDNSTMSILDETYINDHDYMITMIRLAYIDDERNLFNETDYTDQDLDDVY